MLGEDVARLRGARAGGAGDQQEAVARRQLVEPVLELVERDGVRARDVAGVELGRRADVEHEQLRVLLIEDQGRRRFDRAEGGTAHDGVPRRRGSRRDFGQMRPGQCEAPVEFAAQVVELASQGPHVGEPALQLDHPAPQPPGGGAQDHERADEHHRHQGSPYTR